MAARRIDTPDGRYFVAKGRLWRNTDPGTDETRRTAAVRRLMSARRDVGRATSEAEDREARDRVDAAKRELGERGPVWWSDEAPDETGRAPWTSTYAEWWASLDQEVREAHTS